MEYGGVLIIVKELSDYDYYIVVWINVLGYGREFWCFIRLEYLVREIGNLS